MNSQERDELLELGVEAARWWAINAVSQGADAHVVREIYPAVVNITFYQMGLIPMYDGLEQTMVSWNFGSDVVNPIFVHMDIHLLRRAHDKRYDIGLLNYILFMCFSDADKMPVILKYGYDNISTNINPLKVDDWGVWDTETGVDHETNRYLGFLL